MRNQAKINSQKTYTLLNTVQFESKLLKVLFLILLACLRNGSTHIIQARPVEKPETPRIIFELSLKNKSDSQC